MMGPVVAGTKVPFWVFAVPVLLGVMLTRSIVKSSPWLAGPVVLVAVAVLYVLVRGARFGAPAWQVGARQLVMAAPWLIGLSLTTVTVGAVVGVGAAIAEGLEESERQVRAEHEEAAEAEAQRLRARQAKEEREIKVQKAKALEPKVRQAIAKEEWLAAKDLLYELQGFDDRNAELPKYLAQVDPQVTKIRAEQTENQRRQTAAQGLLDAQKLIAKKAECAEPRSLGPVWEKLRQMRAGDVGFDQARKAAAELEKCRQRAVAAAAEGLRLTMANQRKAAAEEYDRKLLESGISATVTVQGRYNDRMRIAYVLFNRASVYQVTDGGQVRDDNMLGALQKIGFKKVTLTTGFGESWPFDLSPPDESSPFWGTQTLGSVGLGAPLML